jgi:hypothetical protein
MALIGLRMMPTFPSSPLRFRTAGFPQYGSKAGLSVGAFPDKADRSRPYRGLPPTFAWPPARAIPAQGRGATLADRRRRASGLAALPQGPSLRSGLCCPGPSSLNRPHPPHSCTRPNFPARRVICGAFAVLAPRQPRPSTSGSELSHSVPSQPAILVCPRRVHRLLPPRLHRRGSPSSTLSSNSALSIVHSNPLPVAPYFGASRFTRLVRPVELLASLTDLTSSRWPQRLLLPSLRSSRSPFSPSDITTVASGYLHWQDLHLLERLLASLHRGSG